MHVMFHSAMCLCAHACFLPPGCGFYSTFHPQLHVWHAHRRVFRSVLRLCACAECIYGLGSYETMSSSCRTLFKHWENPLATHLMTVQWVPFIPPVSWHSRWFVWLIVGRMTRKLFFFRIKIWKKTTLYWNALLFFCNSVDADGFWR